MLVVKLEVWPGGLEARAAEIGRLEIVNVASDGVVAEYKTTLASAGKERELGRTYHERKKGAWALVLGALADLARRRG